MYSMWNMRNNLTNVYTCIEVSLCGVWHGIGFNKFFGSWNTTFLSSRALSLRVSPLFAYFTWFYNRLLLRSTELRNTKSLYFHTCHCLVSVATFEWSGVSCEDEGRQTSRPVIQLWGKNIRLWPLVHKTCFVRAVESSLIYCFQFGYGMCFAMAVIHLAANINQLVSFVFLSATKSAMTTAMILIQVFHNPEGYTFLLVVCSLSGHETVCFIASR
jgi:hypothetical protein